LAQAHPYQRNGENELFLEGVNGLDQNKEHEANAFAEQELIPAKAFSKFIANRNFSKISITAFSKLIGIALGIVVGQLQHKGLLSRRFCYGDVQRGYANSDDAHNRAWLYLEIHSMR
jgi:HTH-type transcriptional regulator / antitoxin HigA